MIKQNIFEFSSESRVHENEHSAGRSPVCFPGLYEVEIKSDLWCYVKDIVYRTKVRDINDLQHRIIEAIDMVIVNMFARTWQEIAYRLDIIRATDGAHVEVY